MMAQETGNSNNVFLHSGNYFPLKSLLCLVTGGITFFATTSLHIYYLYRILISWDVFACCLGIFYWLSFYRTPVSHIKKQAAIEDNSRSMIVFFVVLSIFASCFAVFLLLIHANLPPDDRKLSPLLSMITITVSWTLLHTLYTVKYAHLYYQTPKGEGLDFPEKDEKPDFLDFAYFSFVLGMTFQVSDVSIKSRKIRHIVLWHSLISFGFNAAIIAICINLLAGLNS